MTKNDLDLFWKRDDIAHRENCFCEEAPQVAMGILMSDECVYAELGEEGDPWGEEEFERRIDLNKRYNEKALQLVGKKLLNENPVKIPDEYKKIKRIGEVFGGEYTLLPNTGEWLHSDIDSPEKLERKLDEIDGLNLEEFMFPDNWEKIKKQVYEETGILPAPMKHVRGPVTLATSIYGIENLIYLYYDAPELFTRFSDTICKIIIKMTDIMQKESGIPIKGYSFADDDCALFTPEMYESFGLPILQKVYDTYAPDETDIRYHHCDSKMNHLLPSLSKAGITKCNFGPSVTVEEIRHYMPKVCIDGCLDPIVFMNNDEKEIVRQVRRDCTAIKQLGSKGLNLYTAGSINNGSSLESMRLVMETIMEYGQY